MLSNTGNTPTEAIEMDHDFIRILEYSFIHLGCRRAARRPRQRRVYEVLKDGVLISTNGDRHNTGPGRWQEAKPVIFPLTSLSAMGKKTASAARTSS